MFAISVRVSPCRERSSPRSVGRVTTIVSSDFSIVIRSGTVCDSSPSGPLTWTRPGDSATITPEGSSIGCFPILDISSPDEADDLAADALLFGAAAGHHAARGGQDRDAHAAEDARQAVLARVDATARLGDALEPGDDALAVAAVLELDDEVVEALALLDAVVADVALLLEQAGDLDLRTGSGHRHRVHQRLVGVADAGEHVCDGVGHHLDITNSTWSCRGSRRGARARAGRSGRVRTSCRRPADGRSGCSAYRRGS